MNITTRAQDFEMGGAIDQFAHDQIRSSLRRFDEDVLAVDVYVKDANGPKGGVDMQALIRIRLRNRQVIVLETMHENLYAAIKESSKRAKRAVRRHLRKCGRIHRQRMRDHLNDIGIQTASRI